MVSMCAINYPCSPPGVIVVTKKHHPSSVTDLHVVEEDPPDAMVAVLMRLTDSIDRNTAALRDLGVSGKGQARAIERMHADLAAWQREGRHGDPWAAPMVDRNGQPVCVVVAMRDQAAP
jgi:hypothetical protein